MKTISNLEIVIDREVVNNKITGKKLTSVYKLDSQTSSACINGEWQFVEELRYLTSNGKGKVVLINNYQDNMIGKLIIKTSNFRELEKCILVDVEYTTILTKEEAEKWNPTVEIGIPIKTDYFKNHKFLGWRKSVNGYVRGYEFKPTELKPVELLLAVFESETHIEYGVWNFSTKSLKSEPYWISEKKEESSDKFIDAITNIYTSIY